MYRKKTTIFHEFSRISTPEEKREIFINQNTAVNRINMARIAMILVSIDSSHTQLPIYIKITVIRAILMLSMGMLRIFAIFPLG